MGTDSRSGGQRRQNTLLFIPCNHALMWRPAQHYDDRLWGGYLGGYVSTGRSHWMRLAREPVLGSGTSYRVSVTSKTTVILID